MDLGSPIELRLIVPNNTALSLSLLSLSTHTHPTYPHRRSHSASADKEKLTWRTMLKSRSVWAIVFANVGNNYGWFVLLSWIPKVCGCGCGCGCRCVCLRGTLQYFMSHLSVDLSVDPILAAAPYITAWALLQAGGWVSDYLICHVR